MMQKPKGAPHVLLVIALLGMAYTLSSSFTSSSRRIKRRHPPQEQAWQTLARIAVLTIAVSGWRFL